jgi:predicted TIM-barrel fold metal-dependent hydrolase
MEEILEPELVICDPHHHLWDRPVRGYMPDDLHADLRSGHRVVRTVFIECRSGYRVNGPEAFRPVGETEFVVAADPDGTIGGIVGHSDLRLREIDDVLQAQIEAGNGRFRGVRHIVAWDKSPDVQRPPGDPIPDHLLGDPKFRSGIQSLGRCGLNFEAWLYHPQIPELTQLARAIPEVSIVLDHLGGPLGVGPYRKNQADVHAAWRASLTDLATCPNVTIKLGGIGMPLFGMDWHEHPDNTTSSAIAARWGADVRWCIDTFGVDRAMFESNFPVDKVSCSYVVLWNAFKLIAADASPSEKAALFHDTAVRTYRLDG